MTRIINYHAYGAGISLCVPMNVYSMCILDTCGMVSTTYLFIDISVVTENFGSVNAGQLTFSVVFFVEHTYIYRYIYTMIAI